MSTRALVIALAVSAALNLGLVGYLVGASAFDPPKRTAAGLAPIFNVERQMRFLDDDRRRELGPDRDERRRMRAVLRDIRRAQGEIWEAVRAEPFDPDALAAALQRFREQFAEQQQISHAAFIEIAAKLTPAERLRFAETVRHMERRHRREREPRPTPPRP